MAAYSIEEDQRRKRRKRLLQGVLVGGAAIGIPALANLLISKRAEKLAPPSWGRAQRYNWRLGDIAYQRLGDGPPVVLLHSFGPGHHCGEWQIAAEILGERHTVFAPDLLGWGRSDKPAITYDDELYMQLLFDFLHEVVGERAWLVAAGLPAAYAVQLGVDHPELLRGLGLVVPLGIELHGDEPDFKDAAVHRLLRLPVLGTSALNLYTSRSSLEDHLKREVFAHPDRVDAAMVDSLYRAAHDKGAHAALAAYLAGYLNHGVETVLPRLPLPTWLAWGRQATHPAVEASDLWLRRLRTAAFEVFERSGNLPHAEVPVAFCEKLEAFLSITA
ncbi:MAG: alpha/beta fold hydrolase [Acidobacteriota bacterium]